MFPSRINNKKRKKRHERCLRIIIYKINRKRQFSLSLMTSKTCTFLATEMYKVSKDSLSTYVRDILKIRGKQTENLRQRSQFFTPRVNYIYHETESVLFLAPNIWDLTPNELKSICNLTAFQKAIKNGHQ